ncbi:fungal-specific transcription factor domain-containing protein [Lipomyces tetrasporus]|uniref:Fungal-specific transcription factor domain-containing protein n=1 Tax=Lipomyces tetrasporus TaxID=54092 RepID=A0AAD7QP71_9ASCO|nr:fungal-specific transcription factor domain-containing protein [Lipomyces tetrasporus]KAJ8099042.1 fungal-specific transcription factor domain-containing protein [Lipomyces tetrasporus]
MSVTRQLIQGPVPTPLQQPAMPQVQPESEVPSQSATTPAPKRSCLACRKRHLRCEPLPRNQSGACVWCYEHGIDCYDSEHETKPRGGIIRAPNDGSIMLDGSTSAYGGFQLSNLSFISQDDPDTPDLLHLRQDMQNKSTTTEADEDLDTEMKLDKAVERHLNELYYTRVHPYIPIVPRAYLDTIEPSQVLLSAMYGVACRLPEAIVSSRDFRHIKCVLQNQLASLFIPYEPSLQACQALTLIHLTLELQCKGIDEVEAWPLRLAHAIRMALELKLHRQKSYANDNPLLQEVKRRTFWALFTKDKWTFTGKGYPLMIYSSDVSIPLPDPTDLDNPAGPPHEFFVELINQARVLEHIIPVCFRADRFQSVTAAQFRAVESEIAELGHHIANPQLSSVTRSHLTINFVAIKLLFYSPFFRPSFPSEANLFSTFIPSLNALRLALAHEAVSVILQHATVDLLFSGPSIWSILFYVNLRCFLVALSIKYDYVDTYSQGLRDDANKAIDRVENLAKVMCQDKKWCFMAMSGNLVLWSKRIAEVKMADAAGKSKVKYQPVPHQQQQQQQQQQAPMHQMRYSEYVYSPVQQFVPVENGVAYQMQPKYSPTGSSASSSTPTQYTQQVHPQLQHSVAAHFAPEAQAQVVPSQPLQEANTVPPKRSRTYSEQQQLNTAFNISFNQPGIPASLPQPTAVSLTFPCGAPAPHSSTSAPTENGDPWAGLIVQNQEWGELGDGWDLGSGFTTVVNNFTAGAGNGEWGVRSAEKLEFGGGSWEGMFTGFA